MIRKRLGIGCLAFLFYLLGLVGIVAACGAFLQLHGPTG